MSQDALQYQEAVVLCYNRHMDTRIFGQSLVVSTLCFESISCTTLLESITMLCGIDNIQRNISHIM